MARLANVPKYYWDACAWIALIQQEPGRFDSLSYTIDLAKDGKAQIWTSAFTLAEVYKRPCDGVQFSLLPNQDSTFENFILQDFVTRVQVDFDIGTLARRLLRTYPTIQKPQDGIHLATALFNNLDELHTYDRANLTGLSGKIKRFDGVPLIIGAPPKRPTPAKPTLGPLFEGLPDDSPASEAAKGGR